ncbi:MAG: adenylate/guanylate cyclase domain-containing protein [bacterium]
MRLGTKSLQQRMAFFLLVPVALILLVVGAVGFMYARSAILQQWEEAAMLKLQRAAHQIDMRLARPMEWIQVFQQASAARGGPQVQDWLMSQLKGAPGVTSVSLILPGNAPYPGKTHERGPHMDPGREMAKRPLEHPRPVEVTPPAYDYQAGHHSFQMVSDLKDQEGRSVGRLEVTMRFDYLLEDVISTGWWQSQEACLVDDTGRFLAHAAALSMDRQRLGEFQDPLEISLLSAIRSKDSGTLWGPGRPPWPPERIVGFYRLHEAPWSIVLFARGEEILAPLLRFRNYYAMALGICILLVLVLIRGVVGGMVSSVKGLSYAAGQIAQGLFQKLPPPRRKDELGQLILSFNSMVDGLAEKEFIANTFGRYVDPEVAKQLLGRPEARRLGGKRREVAILMADIRNFTPLSELLRPEETIQIVNRFFSSMIHVIRRHGGIIVDFLGDSVLAFFDPLDGPLHEAVKRAVLCGFEMQEAMGPLNEHNLRDGLPELSMGVGIHAGEVIVGNIGSEARAKYGIVGSPVNLTHRIQQLAGPGEVVVSERVYVEAGDLASPLRTVEAQLKGVQEPMQMYVLGRSSA